ncbi:hypothetical protein B296_00021948 [Ensete ventricosum]|uniref:Uncharacterized protein n=1 Tax=Ensete ventricosum TaxID=4639 RepID=A0A426ZGU6_ENSVE|nr:hypothetical protein B296_00021948 [Ensete ventricosum]
MGVFKPIEPLNNISLEVYGSDLHLCSVGGSVEPEIALHARDPSDRVSFFPSWEIILHAWIVGIRGDVSMLLRISRRSEVSPWCDFLGLDGRPMLNSANKDRIFSSMRLSKASNLALMASSDVMVYASRSVILRSFFCCRVSGMRILEKGWPVGR